MGIRNHKAIVEEVAESVSRWMGYAKDCGVRADHADTIEKKLLLFDKCMHMVNMPGIANEQKLSFINAVLMIDKIRSRTVKAA